VCYLPSKVDQALNRYFNGSWKSRAPFQLQTEEKNVLNTARYAMQEQVAQNMTEQSDNPNPEVLSENQHEKK
jgi:hypothetical protein